MNVLVALAWPNHVHHETAHRWFAGRQRDQARLVHLSHRAERVRASVFQRESRPPGPFAPRSHPMLERTVAVPGHEFWTDDVSIVSSSRVARHKLMGHGQVTDAHLLALAIARRGVLATFDAGVVEIVPDSTSAMKAIHVIVP